MYGENEYGAAEFGDGLNTTLILDSHLNFITGYQIQTGQILAHIRAFINELPSFGRPAYIAGTNMFVGNNELPEWGPTPGVDGDQHGYSPKLSYIVQTITPISSGKLSQVVNEGIILRLETRDGNIDLFTSVLDDSSTINNDGTIFNLPTWIPGPHG